MPRYSTVTSLRMSAHTGKVVQAIMVKYNLSKCQVLGSIIESFCKDTEAIHRMYPNAFDKSKGN